LGQRPNFSHKHFEAPAVGGSLVFDLICKCKNCGQIERIHAGLV
jgi:hypothetical protein